MQTARTHPGRRLRASGAAAFLATLGLPACTVDDRLLNSAEAIGAEGGVHVLDANLASDSPTTPPDVIGVVAPPPDGGSSRDAGSVPDAGCVHVGSDGKPDCDETLALNADFNRDLAHWEEKDAFGSVKWNARDSQDRPSSGSIAIVNTYQAPPNDRSFVPAAAEQCVAVTAGRVYAFSAQVFIPLGQAFGNGAIAVWFYDDTNCGGGISENGAYSVAVSLNSNLGSWGPIPAPGSGGNLFAPVGAQSMSVHLVAQKPGGTEPFQALFDAVRVTEQPP